MKRSLIDQYKQIHKKEVYGVTAPLSAKTVQAIINKEKIKSVLDYGCGQSKFVTLLDVSNKIEFDPAIPGKDNLPKGSFDMVTCLDVLEHVPLSEIKELISEVQSKAKKIAIFKISTRLAKAVLPNGKNAHVTVRPSAWWVKLLRMYFGCVDIIDESKKYQHVTIVCKVGSINLHSHLSAPVIKVNSDPRGDNYPFSFKSIEEIVKYKMPSDIWVEFGTYKGACAKVMLKIMPSRGKLYLLDSFKGLPEDWHKRTKKGKFALSDRQIPKFTDARVNIIKGLFSDTAPQLSQQLGKQKVGFIHMDCDLYSSTKDALENMHPHIVEGTVIVFDEYYNYPEWKDHEAKAFQEYLVKYNRNTKVLYRTERNQVAFQITK